MSELTLAGEMSHRTLDRISGRFGMNEAQTDGGPFLPLPAQVPGSPDGICRVWTGAAIAKMVYVGLAFPPAGLDSHMIFAFTPNDSAVPHFTLDSVKAQDTFAFHLDLIPKVDLGSSLSYLNNAYQPLSEEWERASKLEGLSQAALSRRQYAIMSPWMLAYRADATAFKAIDESVDRYMTHWESLVDSGLPSDVLPDGTTDSISIRDAGNRQALFNADVDPVWHQIAPMIGEEAGARIRRILRTTGSDIEDTTLTEG